MNAPKFPRQLQRTQQSRKRYRSIDERYQHYEMLKSKLTATARTSAEYDAGVRKAAREAGV